LPRQLTVTEQGLKGTEEWSIINLPETIGNIQWAHLQNNESNHCQKALYDIFTASAYSWDEALEMN